MVLQLGAIVMAFLSTFCLFILMWGLAWRPQSAEYFEVPRSKSFNLLLGLSFSSWCGTCLYDAKHWLWCWIWTLLHFSLNVLSFSLYYGSTFGTRQRYTHQHWRRKCRNGVKCSRPSDSRIKHPNVTSWTTSWLMSSCMKIQWMK